MITRREAVRLLGSTSAGALFGVPSGLYFPAAQQSSTSQLSVPPDSPRWALEGEARVAEYLGRKCLFLDGGGATLRDFVLRDGVIDVDVLTPANRGFFGRPVSDYRRQRQRGVDLPAPAQIRAS